MENSWVKLWLLNKQERNVRRNNKLKLIFWLSFGWFMGWKYWWRRCESYWWFNFEDFAIFLWFGEGRNSFASSFILIFAFFSVPISFYLNFSLPYLLFRLPKFPPKEIIDRNKNPISIIITNQTKRFNSTPIKKIGLQKHIPFHTSLYYTFILQFSRWN